MDLRDSGAPHPGIGSEKELGGERSVVRKGADYVQDRAEAAVDHGKGTLSRRIDSVAGALHAAADSLKASNEDWLGRYSRSTASSVERMSEHLKNRDVSTLISDLGDIGRRRPGLFLGGALLSGLALGRFLRSAGDREDLSPGVPDDPDTEDQYWGTHP